MMTFDIIKDWELVWSRLMNCSCGGYWDGQIYYHTEKCHKFGKMESFSRDVGMADKVDLKSTEIKSHPGSSPGPGTIIPHGPFPCENKACPFCHPNEEIMNPSSHIKTRIVHLETNKNEMISYALLKIRESDWHGLADAAMDLRDIDAELKGLNFK